MSAELPEGFVLDEPTQPQDNDAAYDDIIEEASKKYNVERSLIKAMIDVESGGHPRATSPKGAAGLMQIMPDTLKEMGFTDATDPRQNIMAGTKYISKQLQATDGDVPLALARYNAGPSNVAKYGGVPPFPETEDYIVKVQSAVGNYTNSAPNVNKPQAELPEGFELDTPAKGQTQPSPEDPGFFGTVGGDISKRFNKVVDYSKRQEVSWQHPPSPMTGVVAAGQGLLALGDIAGEATMRTVGAITPETWKDALKEKATALSKTEEGKWALDVLSTVVTKADALAKKYPDAAVELESLAALTGAPSAKKLVTDTGKGVVKVGKQAVTGVVDKTKQAVKTVTDKLPEVAIEPTAVLKYTTKLATKAEKQIKNTINTVFKPSVTKARTPAQLKSFDTKKVTAITAIVKNKKNLKLTDAKGNKASRLPENGLETQEALDQTKKATFMEMDKIVKQADGQPLEVTGGNVVRNLTKSIVDDEIFQREGKAAIKYAKKRITDYEGYKGSASKTQELIKVINTRLDNFYKNPTKTSQDYSEAYVDSLVANNLRKDLHTVIDNAKDVSGGAYKEQKKIYGALKAIEEDVAKFANKERNKSVIKLMPTFTDVIAGHQMITGLAALQAPTFLGGVFLGGVSKARKVLSDPNRKIRNMFKSVDEYVTFQKKGGVVDKTKVETAKETKKTKVKDKEVYRYKPVVEYTKSTAPKKPKVTVRPAHEQIKVKEKESEAKKAAAALKKARAARAKAAKGKTGSKVYDRDKVK